jgi:hypothetical protein
LSRVETGRLVSRLLCFAGALVWVVAALYVAGDGPTRTLPTAKALLLGLISSTMFLTFPPLVFIASFARNDALGFLLVCLTFLAAAFFVRRFTSAIAATLLVVVASAGFWGHFVALLFSCYIVSLTLVLAASTARRERRLGLFCRGAAIGLVGGGATFALEFLLISGPGYITGSSHTAHAGLLTRMSAGLAASALDVSTTATHGLRGWLAWKEVPVAVLAVGAWAIGEALLSRRARAARAVAAWAPVPLVVALLQLPLLAWVIGALSETYSVHDVYRPFILVAYLSTVLLSVQIQPWNGATKERATFAIVTGLTAGLLLIAHTDQARFADFPGIWTEWHGYHPFDHSWTASSGPEAASQEAAHRRGNQIRKAHLRELDAYLRDRRVRALVTFEPMLLLLRRRNLHFYYFHYQVPPVVRLPEVDEETLIVRSTIVGRGVRLIAATRNGLDQRSFSSRPQPLGELSECLRENWRGTSGFRCSVGTTALTLELEWKTTSEGSQYTYGFEPATPVRLYRVTRVQEGSADRSGGAATP